jgi:hypothetical protein
MACFNLQVPYGQICIFNKSIEHPFNDWTEKHVSQGFAWSQGSVSFAILVESGVHMIEVEVESSVPLPVGLYILRCEFLGAQVRDVEYVRLVFFSADAPHFSVV